MKGICFTEEMFNAVIDGRKCQTRRIMKPQPQTFYNNIPFYSTGRTFEEGTIIAEIKPRYKVGEKDYLKEPYFIDDDRVIYRFDNYKDDHLICKWENKLFMPEKHARYFIEITEVRCERLQDISDEDCLKEGIKTDGWCFWYEEGNTFSYAKHAYEAIIEKINGRGTWGSNPYVWRYSFKLVK